MKKVIKLIMLAAVLIGAVYGLMKIVPDSDKDGEKSPEVTSPTAKEWIKQIDQLCEKGKWSADGYNNIETGIHTDRVTSNGGLLSLDEENALQKYLFTASGKSLDKQVNELFKQSSYPPARVKAVQEMLAFLKGKIGDFGANSNLTEASNILSEYGQLMGALSFSGSASYSHPLRAFNAMSADAAQSRIRSMKYYNSHFSKNPSIRSKVSNLASDRERAESDYYMNLEKAVERHSRSTQDLNELLDDEIRFRQISTNSSATNRLTNFVKNPDRWQ